MKTFKWLLVVVAAGQLAIPALMIHRQETTLREGRAYKFKTRPVDPADAFRGRYVWLGFEQQQAPWRDAETIHRGGAGYGRIEEDNNGFAVVRDVGLEPPASGEFLKVRINSGGNPKEKTVGFTMPFDRYYMEESKAPKAERAYREHDRKGEMESYAVVRVSRGHAALENVIVAGKPIADHAKEP